MKALVVGGNDLRFNYPSDYLSGEDSTGDAFVSLGFETSFCGINILFGDLAIMDDIDLLSLELTGITFFINKIESIIDYAMSKNIIILGMNEGDAAIVELLQPPLRERYISLLRKCSVVLTNSVQALQCLSAWATCFFIGFPYNINTCKEYYDPNLEKEYIYGGVLYAYRIRMNNYSTIKILTDNKYKVLMTYFEDVDMLINHLINMNINMEYLTLVKHIHPKLFIKRDLSRSWLSINPQILASLGRLVADSAAIGIPCVGTHSGFQDMLYPELIYNGYSRIELLNLVEKCKDKKFIQPIINKAQKRLRYYYTEQWGKNFLEILKNELGIFWLRDATSSRSIA